MTASAGYEAFLSTTRAAADPLRADILRALRKDSFGVLELAHIFDVTQPALSHHLKILNRAGLVVTRRDGNGIYYRRAQQKPDCSVHGYVTQLFETLDGFEIDDALQRRINQVHAERAERSRKFFADHAGEFADQRELICTPDTYLAALSDMLDGAPCARKRALDVGPGDGETLLMLAERFNTVLGIDNSTEMLERARTGIRRANPGNVTLRSEGLRIARVAAPGSDPVCDGAAPRRIAAAVHRTRLSVVARQRHARCRGTG